MLNNPTNAHEEISERELILSDPEIMNVIKKEANKCGVSPEEYVDTFLSCFYENPKVFYNLLGQKRG